MMLGKEKAVVSLLTSLVGVLGVLVSSHLIHGTLAVEIGSAIAAATPLLAFLGTYLVPNKVTSLVPSAPVQVPETGGIAS